MENTSVLPSEMIQKEFEKNPLKLLEEIKLEENSSQNDSDDTNQSENNQNLVKIPPENEDISNIYNQNLNCNNLIFDCNFYNNSKEAQNFVVNKVNKLEGKEQIIQDFENNFVNTNVNNSPSLDEDVYITKNSFDNFERTCNDNINIDKLFIDNKFKNNFYKNVNNKHINISKLLSNLKTYKGSIYAQSLIEKMNNEVELSSFFNDIIPNICQIMCSEYGNYFFQKLIKKLSLEQRLQIYKIIQPEFLIIATNRWGTHSIQSLIDNVNSPYEIYELNLLISKNMYILFTDDNAYHIMMKLILDFPEEQRMVLNLYLTTNIDKIITNNNGAFCVNKFVVNNKNLQLRRLLLDNLQKNLKKIIYNKFSCINLLIIIQTFGLEWCAFIFLEIQENFVALLENAVSRLFVFKLFEFLKSINIIFFKQLFWSIYRNTDVINYIVNNKNKKKLLNQFIELSDEEQKVYLFILLKKSNR